MSHASSVPVDHAGVAVPPPLVYVAFLLVAVVLQRYVPLPGLAPPMARLAGAAFVVPFLVLAVWSFRRFRASGTSIVPVRPTTALVVEGPYRLTRNPMYLGMLCLYCGIACWWGLVWALLLAPVLAWVMTAFVIAREERYLTRKFGDDYRRYQSDVRRWI
jgi:protein-S-isoprenylcysteine O-methyltransferase Ste14